LIHIVGTAHSTQMWSDAIKNGTSCDAKRATIEKFQSYLREVAVSLRATAIAEELSRQVVKQRDGGASVAEQVARDLKLQHHYCDPDREERQERHIESTDVAAREEFWLTCLQPLDPNATSIVFVCGADHCETFKAMLDKRKLQAQIHCPDWTLGEPAK
jgi:hypothetical protein